MQRRRPKLWPALQLVGLLVACALSNGVSAQLADPIPGAITKQGLRVAIEDLAQMPASFATLGGKPDAQGPGTVARINFLRASPDGRLFVNDLRGQVYRLDANNTPQLYLDIDADNGGPGSLMPNASFSGGLAAGLVSFTFHPAFASNGLFYTLHMERAADTSAVPDFATTDQRAGDNPVTFHTVLTEWHTPDPLADAYNADTGSTREVLRVGTTANSYFHPFGDLQFNPTAEPGDTDYGLLYVSGGDWGYINGAGAPQGAPAEGQPGQLQRLDTLAGTMIRIDPRSPLQTGGPAGLGDYTIPPTNPFVDGDPNTFDEVYALGLRNGHRMAWDTDGTLYVSNIGQTHIEEVERIVPGGNYGWVLREGTFVNGNDLVNGGNGDADDVFTNNVAALDDVDFRGEPFLYPATQYDHDEGFAIAGGFVYRGELAPQLYGKFVFGDIINGRLFAADADLMKSVDLTDPMTTVPIEEVQLFTVDGLGVETDVDMRGFPGLTGRVDFRLGIDNAGELYILSKRDGMVRRLVGPGRIPGDTDGDGDIDDIDLANAFTHYTGPLAPGVGGKTFTDGDTDGDGDVDDADLSTLFSGYTGPTTPSPVPEPATVCLGIVLACCINPRRRPSDFSE